MDVDDQPAMDYDLLQLPFAGSPSTPSHPVVILVRMPGLKGGALTEFDIRTRLTEVLQSRGLQGQALGAKLDETMSKLSRTELAQWAADPTWQGLKQVVGTRITYISKPKKGIDPLTIRDPWMQALHEKESAAQSSADVFGPRSNHRPQGPLVGQSPSRLDL